jgi:uncharacterized protein YjbJ (UPF0337 family)
MGATIDKLKGKAKQLEGKLTGDKLRVAQGTAEKTKGDVEAVASRVVRKVKGLVERTTARAKVGLARARGRTSPR